MTQKNILIVEDYEDNQILLMHLLNSENLEITFASDGVEALNQLNRHTYDLIFLDLNLPDLDGFEVSKMIRERGFKNPIIAFTASSTDETYKNAIHSGCNDLLLKSFHIHKIKSCLQKYLYP